MKRVLVGLREEPGRYTVSNESFVCVTAKPFCGEKLNTPANAETRLSYSRGVIGGCLGTARV